MCPAPNPRQPVVATTAFPLGKYRETATACAAEASTLRVVRRWELKYKKRSFWFQDGIGASVLYCRKRNRATLSTYLSVPIAWWRWGVKKRSPPFTFNRKTQPGSECTRCKKMVPSGIIKKKTKCTPLVREPKRWQQRKWLKKLTQDTGRRDSKCTDKKGLLVGGRGEEKTH